MKTKIIAHADWKVSIAYDYFGERIERTFIANENGYVRYDDEKQICKYLACAGPTLYRGTQPLVNIIRREYRRMRQRQRKQN